MFETLFGAEMPLAVRFFLAFLIVLGLIGVTAWVVRRFGTDRLGAAAARGRQPRLAVIDAAAVDGRRRLVLIRRDNVEHLLMIGGPSDVVVEPNIVRTATRDMAPPRATATADTLPRAVPLGEANMWPLQPHPEPARPQRPAVPEEPAQWQVEPEEAHPPQRQARPVDPLAGLAAELARTPVPPDAATPAPRAAREPARMREAPAPLVDPQFAASADQNLADMAHRLEAALRHPARKNAAKAGETAPASEAPAAPAPAAAPRPEAKPGRGEAKAAPQKSVYDSLEQEMASLLGRPSNKP